MFLINPVICSVLLMLTVLTRFTAGATHQLTSRGSRPKAFSHDAIKFSSSSLSSLSFDSMCHFLCGTTLGAAGLRLRAGAISFLVTVFSRLTFLALFTGGSSAMAKLYSSTSLLVVDTNCLFLMTSMLWSSFGLLLSLREQ